jgi:hypothetical protein
MYNEYFKQQIEAGATDNWFYGIEIAGSVRIERHRGPLETLSLAGLVYDRMMGSTPFFRPGMPVEDKKQLIKGLLGATV